MHFIQRWPAIAIAAIATVALALGGRASASELDATALLSTARVYHLRLHHLHTGESVDIVYRVGDMYIPMALDQLNHFLRDHRTDAVSDYDPREFDLLNHLMTKLGRANGVIDIVCGYRSPWSNAFLRRGTSASGVAEHSQHMEARAIDIRVPGVPTARLRDAALSLDAGGVGYYPKSQFVHVDVGPVREWSFGARRRHGQAALRTARYARHRHVHGRRSVIRQMGD